MTKKVLQINSVINSGSTGRIAEEIGIKAMDNGWDSYIAYGRNDRPSRSHKIKIGNELDIKVHGIQTRLFDNHGFASKTATKQFIKKIAEIKPDIIHLHNIHGYYLNINILSNYLASINIPVVWTLHDCWPMAGHCTYFSFTGCEKWKTQCEKCPQKREYPTSYWLDNSYTNYKLKRELFTSIKNMTIVPVSNWLSEIVNQSFLMNYPIQIIHNGIDTNIFFPTNNTELIKKYNLKNEFILLGIASKWEKRKGLDEFIKLNDYLSENQKIILVGLTPKQIKGLPPNIMGIERTESVEKLAELYSLADVFVNPTWEDNFPTTNLEAMACGTPVITYKTGGSPEAIDENTGLIVEQGDINNLLKAVETIRNKGKNYYSAACRKRAIEKFDKDDRYKDYISLYECLFQSNN